MRSFLLAAALCGVASTTPCDVDSYYASVSKYLASEPTSREEWSSLIDALEDLLQSTHTVIPYSASTTDVWDALGVLDADEENPSKVVEIYSNRSVDFDTHGQSTGWNREHLFCRSYGLFDSGPDYSDLFNLRPADENVNSARGNLYFDNCYDSSCIAPAQEEAASDTARNSDKFMPSASERGDIARSAFYMALRYSGAEPGTEELTLSDKPCVDCHAFGKLSTLLEWAAADPVTESEVHRNDLTCSDYQTNRNPFIDFPWLSNMFLVQPLLEQVAS